MNADLTKRMAQQTILFDSTQRESHLGQNGVGLLLFSPATFFAFLALALVVAAGVTFLGALAAGQAFFACLVIGERNLWECRQKDCGECELECFHDRISLFVLVSPG